MRDTLIALVRDELALVERFAAVLAAEQAALIDGTPLETLPALIDQKAALTAALAASAARRDACLVSLGLPAGQAGMRTAVTQDAELASTWRTLHKLVQSTRARNETNGTLIRVRMDYNQQALSALMQASGKPSSTYGPDGRLAAQYSSYGR